MPNTKQGGGYTLTFSKRNKEIKSHLDKLKKNGITITDYICDAIRFFEKNKNNVAENRMNNEDVERIVERKIEEILNKHEMNNPRLSCQRVLEHDLDCIDDEDLEED